MKSFYDRTSRGLALKRIFSLVASNIYSNFFQHHPLWEEYNDLATMNTDQYGAFIHHKWGWKTSIDVTRNLTKFSKRSSSKESQKRNHRGVGKKCLNLEDCDDDVVIIEEKGIIPFLLNKVGDSDDSALSLRGGSSNIAHDDEDDSVGTLANCKFCTSVCHCSPGRRLKRPYPKDEKEYNDREVAREKLLRLEHVHEEVRNTMNTYYANEAMGLSRPKMAMAATNVMSSSNEAFELATNYRKNTNDIPDFTREQIRELLSVELTQDRFRHIYRNPYECGRDEEEEESDDSDDDAVKQKQDQWSQSTTENY